MTAARRTLAVLVVPTLLLGGCAVSEASPRNDDDQSMVSRTAPTPYTAEQIREANPQGTRLVFRMERVGEPTVLRVLEFVEADRVGAVTESRVFGENGTPVGEVERSEATWEQLRDHAAFPASRTRRQRSTTSVPAGRFGVWRYTVQNEEGGPAATSAFHFALDRPGPPVLLEMHDEGRITFRMVLVEDSRG